MIIPEPGSRVWESGNERPARTYNRNPGPALAGPSRGSGKLDSRCRYCLVAGPKTWTVPFRRSISM